MVFAPGAIELAPGLRKERGRPARLGLPIWGRDVRTPRVAFQSDGHLRTREDLAARVGNPQPCL